MGEARFRPLAEERVMPNYEFGFEMKLPEPNTSENIDDYYETVEWCRQQFCDIREKRNPRWLYSFPYFYFKKPDEAFEFKIRWVG